MDHNIQLGLFYSKLFQFISTYEDSKGRLFQGSMMGSVKPQATNSSDSPRVPYSALCSVVQWKHYIPIVRGNKQYSASAIYSVCEKITIIKLKCFSSGK